MATTTASVESQQNIATFRRAIEEGWNKGNMAAIDELFAPDFVEHQAGIGPGRDGVKASIRALRAAFPDLHLTLVDTIADRDIVWSRLNGTGTHAGPFMGASATGRRFEITIIDVARVVGGRLVEHWGVADRLSLVQQLGLTPGGPR
jgi:predicted ester cyclase